MASILTGTITCPECGQLHENPRLWCEDENSLAGARVVCPVTGKSFPLSKPGRVFPNEMTIPVAMVAAACGTEVEETTDAARFQLEEESPEVVIDRFVEWLNSRMVWRSGRNRVVDLIGAERLMNEIHARFGKSQDTADLLRTLKQVLMRRLGEAS